jgi:hypothetical protein
MNFLFDNKKCKYYMNKVTITKAPFITTLAHIVVGMKSKS